MHSWVVFAMFLTLAVTNVAAHGRLVEPPSRASAWRYGFSTPHNYNDNQLFCGGFGVQWNINDGRCGVCGDPWQGPREHEAGGQYATGTIVRNYRPGQSVNISVQITANHKGWFEFRICPHNNPNTPVTQECLDNHLLQMADGTGSRFEVTPDMRMVKILFTLPRDMTCTQCLLQWKYNTGNSWGTDPDTGRGCVGCGPQEQFYGCADVAIQGTGSSNTGAGQISTSPSTTMSTSRSTSPDPVRNPNSALTGSTMASPVEFCRGVGRWEAVPGIDNWCTVNCANDHDDNCPQEMCRCSFVRAEPPSGECRPSGLWAMIPGMKSWCKINCNLGQCRGDVCTCE